MGQEPSKPVPGTKFRVIGAGFSRTGTASFTKALGLLLDGPIYHGGTQVTLGPAEQVLDWTECYRRIGQDPAYAGRAWDPSAGDRPPRPDMHRPEADDAFIMDALRRHTDGYAACCDFPFVVWVPELLRLHPDAVVVATVRDPAAWERSMLKVQGVSVRRFGFLRLALLWLPTLRHFAAYVNAAQHAWDALGLRGPGEEMAYDRRVWERHQAWLREVVPAERLVFFDVRDGWGPLCKALGVDVPEGVEFPRVNEAAQMEEFGKRQVQRGLARWAVVLASAVAAGAALWYQAR